MAIPNVWSDSQTGPASYTTGGFVITTTLSTVASFDVQVAVRGANLGSSLFDITFSGATARVKVIQQDYNLLSSIDGVVGLPAGVTVQSTSGQTYSTVSHTHAIDHTHPTTDASTGPHSQSANTLAAAAQPAVSTHTHTLTLPAFTGTSGAEAAHTHTWDNIYQHQHSLTNTATNLTAVELANTTDLSGTTFIFLATDS